MDTLPASPEVMDVCGSCLRALKAKGLDAAIIVQNPLSNVRATHTMMETPATADLLRRAANALMVAGAKAPPGQPGAN